MKGFGRRPGLGWLLVMALGLSAICMAHQLPALLHGTWPLAHPTESPGLAQPTGPTAGLPEVSITATPTWTLSATPMTTRFPARGVGPVTVTIIYDNNAFDARLQAAWGFACLVEVGGRTVLFDTGGDGATLMANLAALGIDPGQVEAVVLSHMHGDHTGGLDALLASNDHLVVYVPASFAMEISRLVGGRAGVVEVSGPMEIVEGVHTTGEMGTAVVEQSLIVETDRGLVVVTGCAHPGIVEIVRRATAQGEVDLVIGGFHLSDRSRSDVQVVIEELLALGVRRIAPCHCTGAEATAEFEAAFGAGFVPCGVGTVIAIGQ